MASQTDITKNRRGAGTPARSDDISPFVYEASSLLKALGHEGRLRVLSHLRDGGKTVRQLQELMEATQPVVSSHLARLRFEGLVSYEKSGRNCTYFLADDKARQVLETLDAVFCPGLRDHLD